MATDQLYNLAHPRKFPAPIIRPSADTVRAKRREIAVRYRASGYKPTITDLRRAEIARLIVFRSEFEFPGGDLLYGLDDHPPRLKAKTLGKRIKLTDFERSECNIRTILPYDISAEDHRTNVIADRRYRQRLYAQNKRREAGAIPRKIYQNASLSQQKPWKALGISRRTWERRRAKGGVASPSTHTLTNTLVDGLATSSDCPF